MKVRSNSPNRESMKILRNLVVRGTSQISYLIIRISQNTLYQMTLVINPVDRILTKYSHFDKYPEISELGFIAISTLF